jgi:hypothetical protein
LALQNNLLGLPLGIHLRFKSPIDQIPGLYLTVDPIGKLTSAQNLCIGRDEKRRAETYDLMESDGSSLTSEPGHREIGTAKPGRLTGHHNAKFAGLPVASHQRENPQMTDFAAPTGDFEPRPVPRHAGFRKFMHDADRAAREINPVYKAASLYVSRRRQENHAKKQVRELEHFLSLKP